MKFLATFNVMRYIRRMMHGDELKTIRKSARLNQDDFGRLVGMGRVAVSDWETGKNRIPLAVEQVASAIDRHPELLLEFERVAGMRPMLLEAAE
jgi:DNA-binding transcriptional regulator YiaG